MERNALHLRRRRAQTLAQQRDDRLRQPRPILEQGGKARRRNRMGGDIGQRRCIGRARSTVENGDLANHVARPGHADIQFAPAGRGQRQPHQPVFKEVGPVAPVTGQEKDMASFEMNRAEGIGTGRTVIIAQCAEQFRPAEKLIEGGSLAHPRVPHPSVVSLSTRTGLPRTFKGRARPCHGNRGAASGVQAGIRTADTRHRHWHAARATSAPDRERSPRAPPVPVPVRAPYRPTCWTARSGLTVRASHSPAGWPR